MTLRLDPARTAVLSMDCQSGIVAAYAKDQEAFVARPASVLKHARSRGIAVVHVQVGFRPNFPEIASRNALFSAIKSSPQYQKMFQGPGAAIHPALAPEQHDIVVTKHRVSAFLGTDLVMILRAKEIDTLVLYGIATSGVLLSTLVEAADLDYRLAVISDCCGDLDPEVHACLMDKVFPRRATILTAAEFIAMGA